jgi:hypothetical protein
MKSDNLQPPFLGPQFPIYPHLMQLIRVTDATPIPTSSSSSSSSIQGNYVFAAKTQQQLDVTVAVRDREDCYLYDPNGTDLIEHIYTARLVGSYAGLPLYATTDAVTSSVIYVYPGIGNPPPAYNSGKTYGQGDIVSDGATPNHAFGCLVDGTVGISPVAGPNWADLGTDVYFFAANLTSLVNGGWAVGAAIQAREMNGLATVPPGYYIAVYEEIENGIATWAFSGFRLLRLLNTVYNANPTGGPTLPTIVEFTGSAPAWSAGTYQMGEHVKWTDGNEYISNSNANAVDPSNSTWDSLGSVLNFGPQWIVIPQIDNAGLPAGPASPKVSIGTMNNQAQFFVGLKTFDANINIGAAYTGTYTEILDQSVTVFEADGSYAFIGYEGGISALALLVNTFGVSHTEVTDGYITAYDADAASGGFTTGLQFDTTTGTVVAFASNYTHPCYAVFGAFGVGLQQGLWETYAGCYFAGGLYVGHAIPPIVADGTYTVGLGVTTDGTITITNGAITFIQQAS